MKNLVFYSKEFEAEVRSELRIYDRPITDEDALLVNELDCSGFTFNSEDRETLCAFKNLELLNINIGLTDFSFLQNFEFLEELSLEFYQGTFDVDLLPLLHNLRSLLISGGSVSSFDFVNTDAFAKLAHLEDLTLHEFGSADLSFLRNMPCLKYFYCGYACRVDHVEAISALENLASLTLIDIKIDDLQFLDALSSEMILDVIGVNVSNDYNIEKFKRFKEVEVSETLINGITVDLII